MKVPVQQLYDELREAIWGRAVMERIPIGQFNAALQGAREVLTKLKAHVLANPFSSPEDEIAFFKWEKPVFVAEILYATDLYRLQRARPGYDVAAMRSFLEGELRAVMDHFHKYCFLYHYYQFGSSDMDTVLFVRGVHPSGLLLPDTADADPGFSTACDHAWARLMAGERLKEWLIGELRALDLSGTVQPELAGGLKWTGNTVNLAELAYGIWLTGQVNNGQVSISEIAAWLETHFQVHIGDPHRRWQSIAARKRIGPFVYVDEMKAALVKRLEEEWGR